jgi:hypothetical protein
MPLYRELIVKALNIANCDKVLGKGITLETLNLSIFCTSQMQTRLKHSAGILAEKLFVSITVAGQRWTYTKLSPLPLTAVPRQNRFKKHITLEP